tara:strand:- start:18759 stop:19115 length:357 start_codon:yes stop_codon:yes gene_type:complete
MSKKSILLGSALGLLGIIVTIVSDSNSATSLIPAFIGIVFVGLGVAGNLKPELNHHFMHGAAALSLVAILGSLGSLIGRGSTGWALFSQLLTSVLCLAFMVVAIQSFKAARIARQENQ